MHDVESAKMEKEQDGTAHAEFSSAYKSYALILLMFVYCLNVLDRQILSILMEPIKHELNVSDTQLGFLNGFAFAIFYVLMGIPIAMLADKRNRRNIIAIAVAIFSCMTFLSGLVTSFIQLLLMRVILAIGEAGTSPASHSMLSDMFPQSKRASAMSVVTVGANIGILGGFLIGGWISQWYGWRSAFFVVGVPGLILALLIWLTMKEPTRGHADGVSAHTPSAGPFEVAKFLWSQRSFRHLITGVTVMSLSNFTVITWFPSFLMRSYQMSPGEVGTVLAGLFGIVAGVGSICSGYFGDRLGKRDVRWNMWIVAIVIGASFPFYVAVYLVQSQWLALALFIVPAFAYSFYFSPCVAMIHALVPVRMRAQSSAIFLFILSLIGSGIGPQVAGLLSDFYRPLYGQESLRYALLTMPIVLVWATIHYFLAGRTLEADIMRARAIGAATPAE